MTIRRSMQRAAVALSLSALIYLAGCTQTEEAETVAALQDALSNLVQNKSLSEQFVRDIKAEVNPSDAQYGQAMESYQDARDAYNRFLDDAEAERPAKSSRSLHGNVALDAQNTAADFLEDATRALRPSLSTRSAAFQRAIVIPDDLQKTLQRIPRKARQRLTDQFDAQVRWRSWSKM